MFFLSGLISFLIATGLMHTKAGSDRQNPVYWVVGGFSLLGYALCGASLVWKLGLLCLEFMP